ncbi:MAG TPA: GGDEF domain-containing protein [Methylophilaceae bacterium]|nr:GGDEF domain-containing protein [Methylophilaceae bacterium]
MVVVLTPLLSLLLILARVHADGVHGLGHWALGNLCISIGMLIMMMQFKSTYFAILPATTLYALGLGLYLNGTQAFTEKRPTYGITAIIVAMVIVIDGVFLWKQDFRIIVVFNAFIFMAVNIFGARMLLIPVKPPLRTAYWFTGSMFSLMALVFLIRGFGGLIAEDAVFQAMSQWPLNKFTFFFGTVFQLCTTFGFILMLNYKLVERMRRMAGEDWLTGALNRRSLEDAANRMEANCRRFNLGIAMLLIDLDHFKQINDRYGHQFGDQVLAEFARIVVGSIRAGDLFGRYGGEEFCILLPNTSEDEALTQADRLRQAFETDMTVFRNKRLACTISIGVSESTRVGHDFSALFAAADRALYEAKQRGRNRVVPYSALAGDA